ncbi:hypothetical protein [Streptomyces sp. NPDC021622]|uniref:hypothetical protein n=1 Tax=Streptomyces sp. NPDC021622 TaxID=3155013 RepID=UPI0033DD39A6
MLLGWNLVVIPSALVLVFAVLGLRSTPVFQGLAMGLMWTVLSSGQAWKNPERVRALLDDDEELLTAFPARLLPSRTRTGLRGWSVAGSCFLVLTTRRVLVFAHNRVVDVPTGHLWDAPRRDCRAELRPDARRLKVTHGEASSEFRLAARHRKATERFAVALGRGWW